MDAELKAKWVKALRSGEYEQARGLIKDGNSFCCLGVLASVQGATWKRDVPYIGDELATRFDASTAILRSKFAGGLRLKRQQRLAQMNDEAASFKEIADYIEREL